ncbi:arginine decarboxylase, pyruvoyl-dependent [bacterium]|nr:MAG: arginine decarboxylase, pyruvoyl-dependent [bacterium]RKZ21764.1 MAG: arginine decarboxylase, pyruvoyl-dependent [bacterium]RKZ26311.1 MAG: arginine decarboxylase, pyruvoyl-dependent [bacterium]
MFKPRKVFLTKGKGVHKDKLASLELALRQAKIAGFNLVKVSSIFPPHCELVSREEGLRELEKGQIVFTVMAENSTSEPHRLISASVGLAIPKDPTQYGYLSEHIGFGQTEKEAGEYAEDLAASMLATILGVDFDPEASWDEKKEIWRISGKIYRTLNITQSTRGDPKGRWTTVIAAAVFVP